MAKYPLRGDTLRKISITITINGTELTEDEADIIPLAHIAAQDEQRNYTSSSSDCNIDTQNINQGKYRVYQWKKRTYL